MKRVVVILAWLAYIISILLFIPPNAFSTVCGDGICDAAGGENMNNCVSDCPCMNVTGGNGSMGVCACNFVAQCFSCCVNPQFNSCGPSNCSLWSSLPPPAPAPPPPSSPPPASGGSCYSSTHYYYTCDNTGTNPILQNNSMPCAPLGVVNTITGPVTNPPDGALLCEDNSEPCSVHINSCTTWDVFNTCTCPSSVVPPSPIIPPAAPPVSSGPSGSPISMPPILPPPSIPPAGPASAGIGPCGAGIICGNITAHEDGSAVPNMMVALKNPLTGNVSAETFTNRAGFYSFAVSAAQAWMVSPAVNRTESANPSYHTQLASWRSDFEIRGLKSRVTMTNLEPGTLALFSVAPYTPTSVPVIRRGVGPYFTKVASSDGKLIAEITPGQSYYVTCWAPGESGEFTKNVSRLVDASALAPNRTYQASCGQ